MRVAVQDRQVEKDRREDTKIMSETRYSRTRDRDMRRDRDRRDKNPQKYLHSRKAVIA